VNKKLVRKIHKLVQQEVGSDKKIKVSLEVTDNPKKPMIKLDDVLEAWETIPPEFHNCVVKKIHHIPLDNIEKIINQPSVFHAQSELIHFIMVLMVYFVNEGILTINEEKL